MRGVIHSDCKNDGPAPFLFSTSLASQNPNLPDGTTLKPFCVAKPIIGADSTLKGQVAIKGQSLVFAPGKAFPTWNATCNGSIRFLDSDGKDLVRLASDGFYVRGMKLEQDASEAQSVFNGFVQWLSQFDAFRNGCSIKLGGTNVTILPDGIQTAATSDP